MKKRVIAIHLPQFHPFKENDEWWGKGFTEWTNVTKARPRFPGHYQPHLPADLGFYDMRVPEVREQQAEMAREVGIYGFCYYHYWFNGKLLMERPLNEILESGKPDFPFMLCWANENWTRAWDGNTRNVLIEKKYSEDDDRNHIEYLINHFFMDERYIRINNKPVFAIYRSTSFPNIEKTIEVWREVAAQHGLELYICRVESFGEGGNSYLKDGFDAAIDFQPNGPSIKSYISEHMGYRLRQRINEKIFNGRFPNWIDYGEYVDYMKSYPMNSYKRYPCVCPSWDNSSRRKKGAFMFLNSTPDLYGRWLSDTIKRFIPFSEGENFVFINAWNEWAEGNHLEPDQKWGNRYLDITKRVLSDFNKL